MRKPSPDSSLSSRGGKTVALAKDGIRVLRDEELGVVTQEGEFRQDSAYRESQESTAGFQSKFLERVVQAILCGNSFNIELVAERPPGVEVVGVDGFRRKAELKDLHLRAAVEDFSGQEELRHEANAPERDAENECRNEEDAGADDGVDDEDRPGRIGGGLRRLIPGDVGFVAHAIKKSPHGRRGRAGQNQG